jgi:hypothetical protein
VSDDSGLDFAEAIVLSFLEDSPRPLWEIGWAEAPSRQRVAAVLGPGLVSLVARGFVEVRRFDGWPSQWERGVPVAGDDLVRCSGRVGVWSGDSAHDVLAAHIAGAGIPYL